MKRLGGWIAVLLLLSSAAWAQEEEKRSHFAVGLGYGAVLFEDDVYQDFFDQDMLPAGELSVSVYPVRNLALTAGSGYLFQSGKAIGELSGEPSGEELELTIVPVYGQVGYRFDFADEQWVVPSLAAGGDYWLYWEKNEFEKDVEGGKSGWHATAGLGVLLDQIEPDASFNLMSEFGIENTFLELTATRTWMNGDGLDFSGWVFQGGFLFEF